MSGPPRSWMRQLSLLQCQVLQVEIKNLGRLARLVSHLPQPADNNFLRTVQPACFARLRARRPITKRISKLRLSISTRFHFDKPGAYTHTTTRYGYFI